MLIRCALPLGWGGAVDFNLLNIIDGILNIKYMQIYWFLYHYLLYI